MLLGRRKLRLETERLTLRPPDYLTPWEPAWASDHLGRKSFTNRVYWAQRSVSSGTALPLFLIRREDQVIVGAITLDNIRRGPAMAGTLGYWSGQPFARQGYMREAIGSVVHYAYGKLDLSRIEAACLPENAASRGLLEKSGFKYEGPVLSANRRALADPCALCGTSP